MEEGTLTGLREDEPSWPAIRRPLAGRYCQSASVLTGQRPANSAYKSGDLHKPILKIVAVNAFDFRRWRHVCKGF